MVHRFIKQLAEPYHVLAQLYQKRNIEKINKHIEENEKAFKSDQNFGLIKQLLAAFLKQ
jgi:hypothetical protein